MICCLKLHTFFDRKERKPYHMRERVDYFDYWDENEFFDRYRVSKRTAREVLSLIRDKLEPKSNRKCNISPEMKFLLCLRFFATGSFQI